ncbi:hypothetical protein EVAR_40319_1 [Eumeta japonica]|uniref:Endonuclease/exonuclease/phosphatase domain-containing protein n=1 Tax=Eumeta variegata TaxID=151549 RepID=A0A4C1YA38_EUMVA|nr:hypothetical protein EVAR_40319_1 [Eumeta japonica]
MKLGIISIYFEGDEDIEPYIIRTKRLAKSGNRKSDHSWRHKCVEPLVGKPERRQEGQAYRDFLDEMGYILNTGSTPTFETYRGDRICSSIVDVTACSSPLIGRVENWRVDRTATTSDHNAIVFNLRLSGPIKPMEPITTRRYNTNKADWTEFCLQLRNTLQKYGIAEKVERTKRPEDLEANSREYIAAIQEVCEEIFPKIGQRKTKANPLVDSGTKRSKKTSCAKERIRNAAPREKGRNRRLPYGQDDIHSESRNSTDRKLERVLHDPGQGKHVGQTKLLANTFYPDDSVSTDMPFHIRTRERIEDKPVEGLRLSEDDPPFTRVELKAVLRELNPKRLRDQTA